MYYQEPTIEKIKMNNEVLNHNNPVWKEDIEWLINKLEEMKDVVKFYANESNYISPIWDEYGEYSGSLVDKDGGEKARKILNEF